MDPSRCANPHFKDKNPNVNPIKNIDVTLRLKQAATIARQELATKGLPPLVIKIENENDVCIVITECESKGGDKYFIIYKNANSKNSPLIKVPVNKYRYVYFKGLIECRVFVVTKLIRLMFQECKNCQICLRSPVIGMVEFYKCKNTNAHIRIPILQSKNGKKDKTPPIPITRIEECQHFNIFQSNDELVYLIKLCDKIEGIIIDPITKERQSRYNLGKLFWSHQEQTLICLSRDQGFASAPMKYALNNISQHIIVKGPNTSDLDDGLDPSILGTTPPVAKSYLNKNNWKSK